MGVLAALAIINHAVIWSQNWEKVAEEIEQRGLKEKA